VASKLARLERDIDRLKRVTRPAASVDYSLYRGRPLDYIREVLGQTLTPDQEHLVRLTTIPPFKVLCRAAHNLGKTFVAACLVNYRYDCFNPGVTLTTAPTDKQVKDILWKEVRRLRGRRGGFRGPKMARLESSHDHFAHGLTARDSDSFQGQHECAVFIIFDEAEGIEGEFWDAAETMLGGNSYGMLAIYNPTTTTARTAEEERLPGWHQYTLSALNHPNIAAELAGRPPPVPTAIRLVRLEEQLQKWSEEIAGPEPGAVELRGRWYRPGLVAQSRILGIRPARGFDAVWSETAIGLAETTILPVRGRLQIGADIAWYGDDSSAFHVKRGGVSLHHESHNGWGSVQNAARLRVLAGEYGRLHKEDPRQVLIAVDVIGYGAGVYDILRAEGYNAVAVNVAAPAAEPLTPDDPGFPNLRSALWFGLAEEAGKGNVSWAGLPTDVRQELRRQFGSVRYVLNARGQRCVEKKDDTKARLKRSPDEADAVLLAYASVSPGVERIVGRVPVAR
jgi:hypothetical protein